MTNDSFQQETFDLIQRMTGEKNILAIPRIFLQATGDLETGIFLAQLLFWSDKGRSKDGFIYKTANEWYKEIFLSEYSLRKARKKLEDIGILETKVKKANGNPTVHYKLLEKPFISWLHEFLRNENEKTNNETIENKDSLTETTSQNTYKNYNKCYGSCLSEELGVSKNVNHDVMQAINTYMTVLYCRKTGRKHPPLKPNKFDAVYENINKFAIQWEINYDGIVDMMNQFLDSNIRSNHNISHFATEGIMVNRMYETLY